MHPRKWLSLGGPAPSHRAVPLLFLGLFVLPSASLKLNAQELQSQDCSQETSLKSTAGDTPTTILFINQTADAVVVYWLDYSGNRVEYNTLASSASYLQSTYLTHPWVVTNNAGTCLAIFAPLAGTHIARVCGIPDSETTARNGWRPVTVSLFRQTLMPLTASFAGRTVTEEDPGGGTDGCWFEGSPFAPFVSVTGGTWDVLEDNTWGDDNVGIFPNAIVRYRLLGRAPCTITIPQRMVMSCGEASLPYLTDTLKYNIGKATVTNSRAGVTETKTWP
jgi:hypothetical protein